MRIHVPKCVTICDTREQRPWSFSEDVDVIRKGLPVGDYSCEGFETRIALERKSIEDAVRSVTWDRARFFRELEKLSKYDFREIVLECEMADVANHAYESMAHPSSILGSFDSIALHFKIPVFYAGSPEMAAKHAESILTKWWEREHKKPERREEAWLWD